MLSRAGFESIRIEGFEGSLVRTALVLGRLYQPGGPRCYHALERRYPLFGRRLSGVARKSEDQLT